MGKYKVLVADSSSVYKKMFTQAISEVCKTVSVSCAANSDEALELIKHKNFDLLIIDADIPGLGMAGLINAVMQVIPKAFILVTVRPSKIEKKLILDALSAGASASASAGEKNAF